MHSRRAGFTAHSELVLGRLRRSACGDDAYGASEDLAAICIGSGPGIQHAHERIRDSRALNWATMDVGSMIIFYAGAPGAFVDLAADLGYSLHLPQGTIVLEPLTAYECGPARVR